jgi:uncharacterized membrane protein YfcA
MAVAALAAFVGAFVQSATGFGFALVLGPALFAVLEPVQAVTALLALGLVLNVLVLLERFQAGFVDWRSLMPVLVSAIPGLALGVLLLNALSKEALQVGVGVAVILAAAWQLHDRRRAGRPTLRRSAAVVAGFVSGTLTTSISITGPPVVLWLEARGVSAEEFRSTLAASFMAFNLAGIAVLVATEGAGALDVGFVLPLLALVLAGHMLGAWAFRRLDRERFFVVVLLLVVATGVASVVAGLAG